MRKQESEDISIPYVEAPGYQRFFLACDEELPTPLRPGRRRVGNHA